MPKCVMIQSIEANFQFHLAGKRGARVECHFFSLPQLLKGIQHPVKRSRNILNFALLAASFAGSITASAQQSFTERFNSHNASMTALQPAMITPLVTPDPR